MIAQNKALYALLFASGASSLVFEIVWMRGFAIVLGSTQYAMACVITAFMLGLAGGGLAAARWLRRHGGLCPRRYLVVYGRLELFIGVYGLLFTPTLFLGQERYLAVVSLAHHSLGVSTVLFDFGLSVACMLLPTLAMGATLPIACVVLQKDRDTAGLYGANTFGAATGSLAASFIFIYSLGCLGTVYVAAAINAVIFAAATWLPLNLPTKSVGSAAPRKSRKAKRAHGARGGAPSLPPAILAALAFFSGLTTFSFEIVWNRVFMLVLGNRVYVTSVTLFVVLSCLGLGAALSRRLLAAGVGAERILSAGYFAATCSVAMSLLFLEPALQTAGSTALLLVYVVLAIPVPAVALGVVFPMVLALPAGGLPRGVHVGRVYALSTFGSVLGALVTSYLLMGWLGGTRVILVNLALLAGCLVVVQALRSGLRSSLTRAPVVVAVLVAAVAGVAANGKTLSLVHAQDALVLEEDEHGVFSISANDRGELVVRNDASYLVFNFGNRATQWVQESQAHFPALYARSLDRVLVIGSGYGITAGTYGRYPHVGRVDAVEILPLMVKHAERFASGNHGYHDNPRVVVHVEDGRHFLAMADAPYDVIAINLADPYVPGSGSLFSDEFYDLVAKRLREGGIACQHVFGPDAATLYHHFASHFPHVQAVSAYGNGATLIGSRQPLELRNLSTLESPEVAAMLRNIGLGDERSVRAALAKGDQIEARWSRMTPRFTNSDVHPTLEFRRTHGVDTFFAHN